MKVNIVTYSDFLEDVKTLDFPTYEADFPKSKPNPIVVYQKGIDKSIHSNGVIVFTQQEVILHLITDRKDIKSQFKLEKWLKEHEIKYKMSDRYWDSENSFYITEYKFWAV